MPIYTVIIPCTLAIAVTVEAENEEAAKEAAFKVDFNLAIESVGEGNPEIIDFESHNQITRGNVYSGCINEMEVEEA